MNEQLYRVDTVASALGVFLSGALMAINARTGANVGILIPVEPDYEAAWRLHRESRLPLISGAHCDNEMKAVKMLVDAALGIEEDS